MTMAIYALTQPLVLYTHPQLPPKLANYPPKLTSLPLYLLARHRKHVAPQNHRWPQQPEQCCDLPATREAKSGRSVRELIPGTVSFLMHPKFPCLKRIYLMGKTAFLRSHSKLSSFCVIHHFSTIFIYLYPLCHRPHLQVRFQVP